MLDQGCNQAHNTVDLLVHLFKPKDEDKRIRKRQAGPLAALSLLLGIYNTYEIHQLSSTVDQIGQNQKHLLSAVKHIVEQTSFLAEDIKSMDDRLKQLQKDASFREFENELLAMAQLQIYASHQQLHDVERTLDSIYDGFAGKFSPKLVKTKHYKTPWRR